MSEASRGTSLRWVRKGIELSSAGKYEEALQSFDKALDAVSEDQLDNPEIWLHKAACLYALGRFKEVMGCYEHILQLDFKHFKAWYGMGIILGRFLRHEESLACFETALGIDPGAGDALAGKAACLAYLHRPEEAAACFEKAIQAAPDKPGLRRAMKILQEQGLLPAPKQN
jgi:tetratricopeptide (TPR) repeat protein